MASYKGYTFGIELEFWMHCGQIPDQSISGVESHIVEKYAKNIGQPPLHDLNLTSHRRRQEEYDISWLLAHEYDMGKGPEKTPDGCEYYPLEIISMIYKYTDTQKWQAEISRVLHFFTSEVFLKTTESCGFHIHVSPQEVPWTLTSLKHIAAAIITFGDVFERLFSSNRWTEHNKAAIVRNHRSHSKIIDNIFACQNVKQLIDVVNLCPPGANADPNEIYYDQRRFSWNFTNLFLKNSPPTVEFRSPRASKNIDEICKWIVFTVTFVHASASVEDVDYWKSQGFVRNKEVLDAFLQGYSPPIDDESCCWALYME